MKTKQELREIAKSTLVGALANAYYSIADNPREYELTEEEVQTVIAFMNNYGTTMCKAIRKDYYTN